MKRQGDVIKSGTSYRSQPNIYIINLPIIAKKLTYDFFKWAFPGHFFVYFRSFQSQILQKNVGVSGNRTRIVGAEGEHADHLTTTTAKSVHMLQ